MKKHIQDIFIVKNIIYRFSIMSFYCVLFFMMSCGDNPYVKIKKVEPLGPDINPISTEPEIVVREQNNKSEGVFDFGDFQLGQKKEKVLEIINIGQGRAERLNIPSSLNSFTIENLTCLDSLDRKESCLIRVTHFATKKGIQTDQVVVKYDFLENRSQKSVKSFLIAHVQEEEQNERGEAKLLLTPKNFPSGPILLKNISVGSHLPIELELRNVGNEKTEKLTFSEIKKPYKLTKTNCPLKLKVDEFCQVLIMYSPIQEGEDDLSFIVRSENHPLKSFAVQFIKANAIQQKMAARLDVAQGEISRDIYERLGVEPDSLSPYHDIRGVNVGILSRGKTTRFLLKIENHGFHPAKVVKMRHLDNKEFRYSGGEFPGNQGTCGYFINEQGCTIEILVRGENEENIFDLIEVTYEDGNGIKRRLSILFIGSLREPHLEVCETIHARSIDEHQKWVRTLKQKQRYYLPYRTRSERTGAKLDLLWNTQSNYTVRAGTRSDLLPIVKNAMVQFGFNLSPLVLKRYTSAKIELDILKVGTEGTQFDTTEIICLNEAQKCSGAFFIDGNFGDLKTDHFQLHSSHFSKELLRSASELPERMDDLLTRKILPYSISNELRPTIHRLRKRIPIDQLFGDSSQFKQWGGGLNFIIADDAILLKNPKLILETSEDQCPTLP